jgi:hypothetical protein
VPVLYFKHTAGVVDVPASVEIAMSASELAYYVTALRTLDADYFDAYKKYIDDSMKAIQDIVDSAETKLVGIPRFITFCHINDYEYSTPNEIGFFKADHDFVFRDNFAGSVGGCRLKPAFSTLPAAAVIAVWLEHPGGASVRIGSIQFSVDTSHTAQFVMYTQAVNILKDDTISFKVDGMEGVGSVTVSLAHMLV